MNTSIKTLLFFHLRLTRTESRTLVAKRKVNVPTRDTKRNPSQGSEIKSKMITEICRPTLELSHTTPSAGLEQVSNNLLPVAPEVPTFKV